jgi:HEAT repeat protein
MRLPFTIDPLSFFFGFVTASVFWWVIIKIRPLWREIVQNLTLQGAESQSRRTTAVEENHRRNTLRRAQGMHLAAPLFALREILQEPRLLSPPQRIYPGGPIATQDIVSLTLPYMPAWPELAAYYNAPTLTLEQALSGGTNLILIGQPGIGKTVALAHLASLASNRSETLGSLKDAIPFLIHVADLNLPQDDPKGVLNPIIAVASEQARLLILGRFAAFVESAFRTGRALLLLDGFDELTPEGQETVSGYLRLLMREHPKIRIVTTGAPEFMDGLINLGFVPLAMAAWNRQVETKFTQKWGEVWTQYVAVESWAQTSPDQVDPILLNTWLTTDQSGITPFELTLRVWGAYAGDALGPHNLEAIATHVRRLAPSNTPLAALEALAMQVTLTAQPIFDPRKARDWVKSFELPEEAEVKPKDPDEDTQTKEDETKENQKKEHRKVNAAPSPTPGLLGRLATSGLVVSHLNNKMRFVHPVIGGYLAGQALSGFKAEEALINQPDWTGKLLAMRYLASYGDVSGLVKNMLEWSRLPMHRPLLTAARWLRDAPHDAAWRGKLMAGLAELIQAEGLPLSLRGQALAALIASDDPGVPTLFRKLANTLSFELIQLVVLGSGALRDTKSISSLEGILQSPNITARRAACLALVAIGTVETLESVAHILLNGDEEVRRAAAESLANDPTEGHAMLRDGATLADILLRRATVYGLGRIDEHWATELLQKMQTEDDQWVVRNSATEVLEARTSSENPRVPHPLPQPSEIPWLIEFASTEGVGIAPGSAGTEAMIAALKNGKEEERLAVLPYLKQNPNDGVVKQIYGVMYSQDVEAREAAFLTLWEIGASGFKLPDPVQYGFS